MEKLRVECLGCGEARRVSARRPRRIDAGECPRCGYLGWAPSERLTESARRRIRERPVGGRSLYPA